jgi:hypothetical protein
MSVGKNRTVVRQNRTEVAERVIAFLRETYPSKTAENVASDIGVSIHAVEKWLARESAPSLPTFGILAMAYGPEFVARVFPSLTWLDPVVRRRMADKLESEIAERERRLAEIGVSR